MKSFAGSLAKGVLEGAILIRPRPTVIAHHYKGCKGSLIVVGN